MKKKKSISYAKWGYIFILPFFITFLIFSSILLLSRICKKRYCRYPINNTSKIYSQMSQADIRNLRK